MFKIIRDLNLPFYLTVGTALSRFYFNHRYSIERVNITKNFANLFVYKDETELKIDFVNDLEIRFGEIINDKHFGKVDGISNNLSNKISALYRFEIKDYIDIWCIAKNYKFNWRELINQAKQKEVTVDPIEIFNLFKSFPFENLDAIRWVKPVDYNRTEDDFYLIAEDILNGSDNSLVNT